MLFYREKKGMLCYGGLDPALQEVFILAGRFEIAQHIRDVFIRVGTMKATIYARIVVFLVWDTKATVALPRLEVRAGWADNHRKRSICSSNPTALAAARVDGRMEDNQHLETAPASVPSCRS